MKELLSRTKERAAALSTAAAVALLSSSVFAQTGPNDIGDLADSISFDDVAPGVLGAAGALIGLYVIIKGVRIIIGFVRSA